MKPLFFTFIQVHQVPDIYIMCGFIVGICRNTLKKILYGK